MSSFIIQHQPDFSSYSEQPWYSHNDKIMKIVIEDGITTIGQAAFWMSKALTVRLPDSVAGIKNHAFRESSLISVTIPGSVKTIGDDAFRACANLALAAMMEGVSTIGQRAFQGCTKLVSVDLPASITDLGAGAFYNCTELNFVTFASGNENTVKIGDNLFMVCWNLFPLTLPEHIDKISKEMFYNCYYLFTGLEIPQGVTTVGESAFSSCSAMSVLIIPNSVTDIERSAFLNTGLTDIYFKGTEAQWKKIWKSPDLTPILQNVTMHYGELPEDPAPNPKHEHEWGRSEVIQEATETEDGLKIYYCTICDETLRELIPASIATPLPEVTEEPTAPPTETVTPLPNVTISPTSKPAVGPTPTPEIPFTLKIIGVDSQNRVIKGIKVEGDANTDNAIGIVALYNLDGTLKQLEITKSNTVIHDGTYELNHSIKYDNDEDICKVFVWKGFDTLKPLAAAYEYSIEKQYAR